MMEYKYLIISDLPYKQLLNVKKEDCRSACAADPKCNHVEYRLKDKRCALGALSCAEAKKTHKVRVNTDFNLIAKCPLGMNDI